MNQERNISVRNILKGLSLITEDNKEYPNTEKSKTHPITEKRKQNTITEDLQVF